MTIFSQGGDGLNKEFKDLLFRHSKPMLPVTLLNIINMDDDTSGEDVPSPQIPDNITSDLERMADWLISNHRDEFMTVYGRVRGSVLLRSLQMLKEHQRSASGGSVQGIHTSTSSPMLVISLRFVVFLLINAIDIF